MRNDLLSPFESKDISLAKLISFTSDNMERMSAQNSGGWLSDRIAATSMALTVLEDAYTENFTKLGYRRRRALPPTSPSVPPGSASIGSAGNGSVGSGSGQQQQFVIEHRQLGIRFVWFRAGRRGSGFFFG